MVETEVYHLGAFANLGIPNNIFLREVFVCRPLQLGGLCLFDELHRALPSGEASDIFIVNVDVCVDFLSPNASEELQVIGVMVVHCVEGKAILLAPLTGFV